jgi:hypothetical protein
MKTSRLFPIIALIIGCRSGESPDAGTVVGNPGDNTMRIADGLDVEIVSARTAVDSFAWVGCGGDVVWIDVDAGIDLLGDNRITAPNGSWCEGWALLSDVLVIEAVPSDRGDEDETLELYLDLEMVSVFAVDGFTIEGDSTVLEVGYPGWLTMDVFEDDDEWPEGIDPDHPEHDALVEQLVDGSTLFEDNDGDGRISENERDEDAIATGDLGRHEENQSQIMGEEEDEEEEDNSGANTDAGGCGGGSSGWIFLPLSLLGLRRKSEHGATGTHQTGAK